MGASSVSSPKRAVLAGPSPLLNRPRTGVQGTVRGSTGGQAGANESFEQALRSSGFDKSPFTAALGNPCGILRIYIEPVASQLVPAIRTHFLSGCSLKMRIS